MALTYRNAEGVSVPLDGDDIGGGVERPAHSVKAFQGAAHLATSQVATSTTAATLAVARATRRKLTITNLHASILIYVGPVTVTSANGMAIGPGATLEITWVGLLQVIAASGTPGCSIADEYD